MSGDLVARSRVEMMRSNLEQIRDIGSTLGASGTSSGTTAFATEVVNRCKELKRDLASAQSVANISTEVDDIIDRVQQRIKDLRGLALDAQAQEADLRPSRTDVPGDRQDLHDGLVLRAGELLKELDPETIWRNASEEGPPLREAVIDLFAEFVDVVRGAALRDTSLTVGDQLIGDLFRIADHLPRLWGRVNYYDWTSIAIPARVERDRSSGAMVLRIGYPEWTVWAVPLVQHQYGQVFLQRHRESPRGRNSVLSPSIAAHCDAAAAIVTGPAFACPALLLRLDPSDVRAIDGAPTPTARRSAAIIAALRSCGPDASCSSIIDLLAREWVSSVEASGGDPEAFDASLEYFSAGEGVAQIHETRNLIRRSTGADQPMWAKRWPTVVDWAFTGLRSGSREIIDNDTDLAAGPRPVGLGMVLNAAWVARLGEPGDPGEPPITPEADPTEWPKIEALAMHCLIDMLGETTAGGTGPANVGGVK